MEQEEPENPIDFFKRNIIQLLKDISYSVKSVQKKCDKVLKKVDTSSEVDADKLETAGLEIIKMCGTLSDNATNIRKSLEDKIKLVNDKRTEKIFTNVFSRLSEYGKSEQARETDQAQSVDVKRENLKAENEDVEELVNNNGTVPPENLKLKRESKLGLAIERTDTQDTTDSWIPTLNRSPTASDLWNMPHTGEKIKVTEGVQSQQEKGEIQSETDVKDDVSIVVEEHNLPKLDVAPNSQPKEEGDVNSDDDKTDSDLELTDSMNVGKKVVVISNELVKSTEDDGSGVEKCDNQDKPSSSQIKPLESSSEDDAFVEKCSKPSTSTKILSETASEDDTFVDKPLESSASEIIPSSLSSENDSFIGTGCKKSTSRIFPSDSSSEDDIFVERSSDPNTSRNNPSDSSSESDVVVKQSTSQIIHSDTSSDNNKNEVVSDDGKTNCSSDSTLENVVGVGYSVNDAYSKPSCSKYVSWEPDSENEIDTNRKVDDTEGEPDSNNENEKDTYINPYSVETVKLSDSDESQCPENLDATQIVTQMETDNEQADVLHRNESDTNEGTKSLNFVAKDVVNNEVNLASVEGNLLSGSTTVVEAPNKSVVSSPDIYTELDSLLCDSREPRRRDVNNDQSGKERSESQSDSDATLIDEDNHGIGSVIKDTMDIDEQSNQSSEKSYEFDIGENLNIEDCEANEGDAKAKSSLPQVEAELTKEKEDIDRTVVDSDSEDDVHLDVTMEEIISEGSSGNIEIMQDKVITIKKEEPQSGDSRTQSPQNLPEQVGDELLELLREVKMPSVIEDVIEPNKSQTTPDTKKEAREADAILKLFEDDSSCDISDSESSESDLNFEPSDLERSNLEHDKKVEDLKVKDLTQFNLKECYVNVELLEIDCDEFVRVDKDLDNSIDRLCDISNLIQKRKCSSLADPQGKSKRLRNRRKTSSGISDSETLSDFSNSDSDSEQRDKTMSPNRGEPVEQKLDDMLANEICKEFKSDDSNETSGDESDDSNVTKKTKKGDETGESKHGEKQQELSREERMRKAWKNDPLLRGKLTSDSESSSDSSESKTSKQKRNMPKYERDSAFNILSDTDTDSDTSTTHKLQGEAKFVSLNKQGLIMDCSDTDSEIEFIPEKEKSPQKNPDDTLNSSQKGRRNIRALMSDESLAEATQIANKEEQERIERLEDRIQIKESFSQSFSQGEEEDLLVLDVEEASGLPLVKVHPKFNRRLKPHQVVGIQFMWDSCYESLERIASHSGTGCILAHCMGLGKTFQVLTLIHTLFAHEETKTRHVLVVCPLSTVSNWKKEYKIAFKDFKEEKFSILTIADKKEISQKYEIIKKWHLKKKSILVMGYEGFETLTNETKLEKAGKYLTDRVLEALIDPGPDLVICDEGHLLRNKKALKTQALNRIKTKRRIVLTGTPLQNNLMEYYHMVHFVKSNLLGNMQEFKTNFVNPITNGQYEDSTKEDIKLMLQRTHVLHKLLKKTIQRVEDTELKRYLPKIVDHAIFVRLHQVQVDLYKKFSDIAGKKNQNTNRKGFLSDFAIFQYICTHPHLLVVMENLRHKKIKECDLITNEQDENPICNVGGWWKAIMPEDAQERIEYGNKLVLVRSILEECEEIEDKVLIFSQSLGELDLIEHFLKKIGTKRCPSWQVNVDYYRMDGTVVPGKRCGICDSFNDKSNKRLRLLLMSTKVGGLGLNLTAANRVIIMTVNWNPSFDTQSVFRVYRFGQEKEVFVYRLVALDTMEEKVYQRTVTKLAIAHRVVDKHQITRHYKSMDLQELYSCMPNADEERPISNVPEDKVLAKLILKLPFIFKYHEHQALLANRPEDNLNEQELNAAWDEFKRIKDAPKVSPPDPQLSNLNTSNTNGTNFGVPRPGQILMNGAQNKGGRSGTEIDGALPQYYNINTYSAKIVDMSGSNTLRKNPVAMISTKNRAPNFSIDKQVVSENPKRKPGLLPTPVNGAFKKSVEEQDPLYIPPAMTPKPKQVRNLSLKENIAASASIVIDDEPAECNQKENSRHLSESDAIVIDDDYDVTTSKAPNRGLSQNNSNNKFVTPGVKRKRQESHTEILKKMRDEFNSIVTPETSIVLDDDVSFITDTVSDSGSLSNEIIKNLGLSGITIHKVMKEAGKENG